MAVISWGKPRQLLALAALLDAVGLAGIFSGLAWQRGSLSALDNQHGLMAVLVLSYCTFGWLFGSYTLLKLRRIRWPQMVLRLGATSTASVLVGGLMEWGGRVSPDITLLHRSTLIPAFLSAALWSGCCRWALRRLREASITPHWMVLKQANELSRLAEEWGRTSASSEQPGVLDLDTESLQTISEELSGAEGLALSAGIASDKALQELCETVVGQGIPVISLTELAEQELQRIPPHWVGDQWLLFTRRIDGQRSTPNQQLKRYADVVISLLLLLVSAPIWVLAALLIRLQDGGPVLYRQERTGLFGQTFNVVKFRTMVTDAERGQALWAQTNDQRITPIGYWLRRTRIDELPQLINVLRGEMSLIGPRPERPELEVELEKQIPNYRLRHWIRPGLSGWAQVNMPYGASIQDSELKLSYDLFYLRNASPWLDFLVFLKTIKTVLKAAGR